VFFTLAPKIFYYVEDSLGSSSIVTTSTGVVCYDADFYPFGTERPVATACPQNYKFEGKERDAETSTLPGNTNGNDDFGARYYSNRFGRWLSADWSSVPVPVPYANLSNPQTLNLYAMVSDDPESFADLDGHADDDIVDHILNFVVSAGTTWLSDNAFGAFRPNAQSVEGKLGQAVGDFAAQQSGIAEAEAGTAGLGTSRAMALVPGGQEEAAGAAIVSEAAVLHGAATAAIGTVNLAKDAQQTSSGGPKANDAPGVSAGGQATDKHGNKLGPSGEPQVNKTRSNTREGARNKALNEGSGATEHRTPKQGDPHFHPTDNKGKKKPSSTHHEYPD
jgi:RHS repeat-associated protein